MRTWQKEAAVVLIILCLISYWSGKGAVEWIGTFGVFMSFMHAQVSDRLAEKEALRAQSANHTDLVECYRWERVYFYAKEAGWLAYFWKLGAYSALAGVALFLLYRAYRKVYRHYYPL